MCVLITIRLLGYSIVRNDPLIVSIAEKYKVTPTQVILAWHISRGTIVVPKSEKPERQKENITVSFVSYKRAPMLTQRDCVACSNFRRRPGKDLALG